MLLAAEPTEDWHVLARFGCQGQPKQNIITTIPSKKDKTNQTQTKTNPAVPSTLNGSRATDQQSYEKNKPEAQADKVQYAKRSEAIPSTSTFRNTKVPTVNTIDAVIVECPTKHEASDDQNTEVKPHPPI